MIRQLLAIILLISLFTGNLHARHDQAVEDLHDLTGCSISSACDTGAHTNHDSSSDSHDEHCCDTHSPQQAITGQFFSFSNPIHDKQFSAVVPHLVSRDFSRMPFVPPRIIS